MSNHHLGGGAVAMAMASAILLFSSTATAETSEKFDGLLSNSEITFGGFVKADFAYSDFSDGVPGDNARTFYAPSRVPVAASSAAEQSGEATDFHARETRINLTARTDAGGYQVKGFVEVDFLGSHGSEVATNPHDLRLRHAFFTVDNWLFGQTWSNFMDRGAAPETLDLIGPTESMPFVRQAQVRATFGGFSVALENPETQIVGVGAGTESEEDLPDVTARFELPTSFGHFDFAAVVREISTDGLTNATPALDEDGEVGFGLAITGAINFMGKDNFKFGIHYGDGLGRYIALGLIPGAIAVTDPNTGDVSLETIAYTTAYIALQHHWSNHWRSNLVLGTMSVDDENFGSSAAFTEDASSAHLNLLYSPVPALTFGGELIYAKHGLFNGEDGDMTRLQFSAKVAI